MFAALEELDISISINDKTVVELPIERSLTASNLFPVFLHSQTWKTLISSVIWYFETTDFDMSPLTSPQQPPRDWVRQKIRVAFCSVSIRYG
jgi:hypothetical protein